MGRLRIAMAALLITGLTAASTGVAYAGRGAERRASFCKDVRDISSGFLALEDAGAKPGVIKDLIKQYKKLEREAPSSVESSIRVIRRLAEKFWRVRPSNAQEAAQVVTPKAARQLAKASKKLGTYIRDHCT